MELEERAWNWAQENPTNVDAWHIHMLLEDLSTPGLTYSEMADAQSELERLGEKWNFTN